ncbi:MAG: chloramphenicol acetyltransferase [Anaerolineales bacterium]|jgi:chloramphenicol O-acetyltransferase type A
MRVINMDSWSRRKHFDFYNSFEQPHFGMCANVDLTEFHRSVKRAGHSINIAIIYLIARAANGIAEFRCRIRGEQVVEHEIVHPSPTILTDDDLFSFCTIKYSEDYAGFAARAAERIAAVKAQPTLEDEPGQDDLLFMTAIPWVSFTSFKHPMPLQPTDSVPRFAWGKFFEEGEKLKMPLAVQAHHALMDGLHVGRYYTAVQELLDRPEFV